MKYAISLIIMFLCFGFGTQNNNVDVQDLMVKSLSAIKEVKGLKYHLKITERGRKGFNYYESSVKFIRNPRQIYLYIKGIEVLWVQGTNNGKALVKPNSFPFFNLNLDPMGDLMRQDQHHTLNEMGYDYFASVIQHTIDKMGSRFNEVFKYAGEERINNRLCHKIVIDNKDFKFIPYTIGDNESITSIARKFYIPEYLILERNPSFKDYFDILKKGQVISIPNWYSRFVTIYIDQFYLVPISIKAVDDRGLFEEYNYHFLQVNPQFQEGEFKRNFKGYGF